MAHPLAELALVFLKIGAVSFGGPAAHVALMEDEVVRRRGWITREEFLDLLGATNLIPGPNSTEMALHIGLTRNGLPGLLVAGFATIAPAFVCVLALAWAYVRFGARPEVAHLLNGIKPVMLAIVLQALVRLGRTAWSRPTTIALGLLGLTLAYVFQGQDLAIIVGVGLLSLCSRKIRLAFKPFRPGLFLLASATPMGIGGAAKAGASLGGLFLVFFKIGGTLFGSGYVLLSFLRADLVIRLGWLTESQLLDAIAVGQITPGPLFTSATFIGYILAGIPGAVVATVGIFLPAFLLVALSGPIVARLRRSEAAGAFLDGVNAASVALMAVVTLELLGHVSRDVLAVGIFIATASALLLTRINPTWLILAGAILGIARGLLTTA